MNHPDVVTAIEKAFARLKTLGVPVGIMALDPDVADKYIALGSAFTAVGVDLVMLADSVEALRRRFDNA